MALLNAVIDLSHHNNVTSYQDIRDAGIVGIIHKATQGVTGVDGTYGTRKPQALAAGLLWGAYHFASKGNAQKQADHFLDVVQPGPTDLLVLDFEPNAHDGTMTVAEFARPSDCSYEVRRGAPPWGWCDRPVIGGCSAIVALCRYLPA